MDIYSTEDGRTIVVVFCEKKKALSLANRHFKCKKEDLICRSGYVNSSGLWWNEEEDCVPCFAVYRRV